MRAGDLFGYGSEVFVYFTFIFKAVLQHLNLVLFAAVILSNDSSRNREAHISAASLCSGLRFYAHLGPNRFIVNRIVKGDEFLTLVISDDSNRIYRLEKDLSSALSKDWHRYTINFRRVKKAVDLSSVSTLKFEFGRLTAGNYPSAIVFLKDIYVAKTRRLKWL